MKTVTDKEIIEAFATNVGLSIKKYTQPMFITNGALKAGAVESWSLQYKKDGQIEQSDLNFEIDKKGKIVGYSTSNIGSFKKKLK